MIFKEIINIPEDTCVSKVGGLYSGRGDFTEQIFPRCQSIPAISNNAAEKTLNKSISYSGGA